MTIWLRTALLLVVAIIVFVNTDRWFSVVDDETTIVDAAHHPVIDTVRSFLYVQAAYEHTPLFDILLHCWMPIGGGAKWSIRLPSVLFYLLGLLILALAARKLAGDSAFTSLICIGLLWPFGFHFGRMIGWYSFCFFLVAAVTWSYLHYLERPVWPRLATFVMAALVLVYSNFYGWVIVGCLAIDLSVIRRHRDAKKFLAATFGTLIILYAPVWMAFMNEVENGVQIAGQPLVPRILNSIYNFYSLFVSESVAPWFWYLSIPASLGIAGSIFLAMVLLSKEDRRFLIYFFILFGGTVISGIINTKRLLFISDWLLLSFAVALANTERKRLRNLLMLMLAFVAAIGWAGIAERKHYSAQHFIEPWAEIADQAAASMKNGGVIISNSQSFLFNVNYALQRMDGASKPIVITVERWANAVPPGQSSVLFVRGVNNSLTEQTEQVEAWLHSHCSLSSAHNLVPDSGYDLKSRFFKGYGQVPFRISLQQYQCGSKE